MKVTLKTTHYILVIAMVNLLLKLLLIFRSAIPFSPGMVINRAFDIVQDCTYLIPLVYLVYLLKFINQARPVVIAFIINCLFSALVMALGLFITRATNHVYFMIIGFFSFAILINLEVQIFRIKHYVLTFPFRMYGITVLSVIFIHVFNAMLLPFFQYKILSGYSLLTILNKSFTLIYLLPQAALLFILYKTAEFLKQIRPDFEYIAPNLDDQV